MVKTLDIISICVLTFVTIVPAYAYVEEKSPISEFDSPQIISVLSDTMPNVNFDGAWSSKTEWKQSSLNEFSSGLMIVRIAHYDEFLYLHVNNLFDITNNRGADRTIACLSPINGDDDFWCFVASRGLKTGHTLIGNSVSAFDGGLKLIPNPEHFIGIGGTSSVNDRYTKTPHAAYEFKIPLESIGNAQSYKFFIKTIDGERVYTFPENMMHSTNGILPLEYWGELTSRDKTMG